MSATVIDYRCPKCASQNVAHDCSAHWDFAAQRFVLNGVQDYATCQDCGHEEDHAGNFMKLLQVAS